MDEQCAKIDIPPLANAQQTGLAARGVLAGYEAEPCGKLAAVFEVCRIGHGGHEGRGRQWPDARNGLHPLAYRMGSSQRLELLVVVGYSFFQGEKLIIELPEHFRA